MSIVDFKSPDGEIELRLRQVLFGYPMSMLINDEDVAWLIEALLTIEETE